MMKNLLVAFALAALVAVPGIANAQTSTVVVHNHHFFHHFGLGRLGLLGIQNAQCPIGTSLVITQQGQQFCLSQGNLENDLGGNLFGGQPIIIGGFDFHHFRHFNH